MQQNSILRITRRFLTIGMSLSGGRRVQIVRNALERKKERMMRYPLKVSSLINFFSAILCLLLFILSYQFVEAQESSSVERASRDSEVIFHLREGIKFADGAEVKSIAKDEIDGLRDLPVSFGENQSIESVRLQKKKGDAIEVRTCREYDAALKLGYSPANNMERKLSSFFKYPCALLNALEIASVAEKSFITDAEVGIVNVELLPFSLFPHIGEYKSRQEFARDLQTTYQQKIETGALVVREKTEHVLEIEFEGLVQSLQEIVRADFNNDGIEDVLVDEAHWVTQGTYSSYGIIVLTRKSMTGKFEVVRPLDPRESPYFFD